MSINTLVVDEDPIFVMMLTKLVVRDPFYGEPKDFSHGQQALDFHKISKYDPSSQSVIFLDINMPVMNGWEFLEQIREFADPKHTLVFVVTSSINEAYTRAAANNEYVLDFLTKSILGPTLQKVKEKLSEKVKNA